MDSRSSLSLSSCAGEGEKGPTGYRLSPLADPRLHLSAHGAHLVYRRPALVPRAVDALADRGHRGRDGDRRLAGRKSPQGLAAITYAIGLLTILLRDVSL